MEHRGDPGRVGLFVISRRCRLGSNNCCHVAGPVINRPGDHLHDFNHLNQHHVHDEFDNDNDNQHQHVAYVAANDLDRRERRHVAA